MFHPSTFNSILSAKYVANNFGRCIQSIRWKSRSPNHWTNQQKKKASDKALEHFDDFYASVFKHSWRSIRLALLSPHKYCAIVNNYADVEETMESFENRGALNMRNVISIQKDSLLEKKQSATRRKELENIDALDLKLEKIAEKKKYEELRETYPGEENIPKHVDNQENLTGGNNETDDNQLDWSRQIDASSGVSASALYEYIPTTKLKGREDWVSESEHYMYYGEQTKFPVEIVPEDDLIFPSHLQVYSYEMGNVTYFEHPKPGKTGVFNYYLMNASSLLPVLALNLSPGDQVLDMCAAPGGKSLVALQTLYPDMVVCNDISRADRLHQVMNDYFYDYKKLKITRKDGRYLDETSFNKILVDVPCTNDRHSVKIDDNNIFKQSRLKERFRIPELQSELLSNALKIVKAGGTVVYSTCSLSPIQNDGVVQMALNKIWQETDYKIVVKDMSAALEPTRVFYQFDHSYRLKYGHLVVPYLPNNYGPLYFCKLVRVE